jgi:hypothetical protein
MSSATFAELDAMSTEELREQAFARARDRRDLAFFWQIFEHARFANDGEADPLGLQTSVDDAVALWQETTGHDYGEQEPLIRAAFIDYLLKK